MKCEERYTGGPECESDRLSPLLVLQLMYFESSFVGRQVIEFRVSSLVRGYRCIVTVVIIIRVIVTVGQLTQSLPGILMNDCYYVYKAPRPGCLPSIL